MKLTGNAVTTISGLSEGMFWDFKENKTAGFLLDYYKINKGLVPESTAQEFNTRGSKNKWQTLASLTKKWKP